MLAHIHPSRLSFTCETRPIFHDTAYPGSESGAGQGPPGAQSPFAPSGMMLPSPMETLPPIIAHTGSCARPKPSRRLRLSLIRRDGFRGHSCPKTDLFSFLPQTHTTQRTDDTVQTTDIKQQPTAYILNFFWTLRPQKKTKKPHPSW